MWAIRAVLIIFVILIVVAFAYNNFDNAVMYPLIFLIIALFGGILAHYLEIGLAGIAIASTRRLSRSASMSSPPLAIMTILSMILASIFPPGSGAMNGISTACASCRTRSRSSKYWA